MMGRSCFLTLVLISGFLLLSFSQGYGGRIKILRHYERRHPPDASFKERSHLRRQMVEMEMDYKEPGANTNPKGGAGPPRP